MRIGVRNHLAVNCAAVALGGALVAGGVLAWNAVHGRPVTAVVAGGTGTVHIRDGATSVTIGGNAGNQISPGVRVPLDLTLTNPENSFVDVTNLTVRVLAIAAPSADPAHPCSEGDFTVDQVPPGTALALTPRATRSLADLGLTKAAWPHIRMLDRSVNQDGCKGATLTLAYSASGRVGK